MVSLPRQREDYRTVVGWAAAQPTLDASRIVVWGTSFAGLHVVDLAVTDRLIAGAIAQSPLVDAVAAARLVPTGQSLRLFGPAAQDAVGGPLGRPPRYAPGAGDPGDLAIGTTPDSRFGERLMNPDEGTVWRNQVAARSLLNELLVEIGPSGGQSRDHAPPIARCRLRSRCAAREIGNLRQGLAEQLRMSVPEYGVTTRTDITDRSAHFRGKSPGRAHTVTAEQPLALPQLLRPLTGRWCRSPARPVTACFPICRRGDDVCLLGKPQA
ncbi:hypothetical protein ABZU76_39960 [Amycolatopsis sp. NPDC005232]|uniref:hypothetical protein n=1 Tax=Amycolatopsis sp. NPDC005232 TaxID=3157027 RepID=UPI0033BE65EA